MRTRAILPEGVYTGIWWCARFPNHYAGDGSAATHELGESQMRWRVDAISKVIVAIKADDISLKVQNEFYEKKRTLWTHRSSTLGCLVRLCTSLD